MAADLPLNEKMSIGVSAVTMPAERLRETVEMIDRLGYDVLWVGDHLEMTIPMLDPLLQLAQAAAYSDRLTFGTGVYLTPLRHPVAIAKLIASLDRLTGGRFIFGVGIGGEFPNEYAAVEVPVKERGARLSEALPLLRTLMRGEPTAHQGRHYSFPEVTLNPPALQPNGPPIWCGGRADAALKRTGQMADGWFSYVVTPEQFTTSLETIAAAAGAAGRTFDSFGTAHILFARIDDSYEKALDDASEILSARYAMDFRRAAQRYVALGPPADIAETIAKFHAAGVRHIAIDMVGNEQERDAQLRRFAEDVRPLLGNLT